MKVNIVDYNIETDLDDLCQAFYDLDKDEVLNSIKEEQEYYGNDMELVIDADSGVINCELYINNSAEIVDWINDLHAVKGDEFVLIRRHCFSNVENDDEYTELESYNGSFYALLIGDVYEYKTIATEDEEIKFDKAQEDELLIGNPKYIESYLIRLKNFNPDNWLENWLKDDDKQIDDLRKFNPTISKANPRSKKLSENIKNINGINIEYVNDFTKVKYYKKNNIINGLREIFFNEILVKSEEYLDGTLNGCVKEYDKESGNLIKEDYYKKGVTTGLKYTYWNHISAYWRNKVSDLHTVTYKKNNKSYEIHFGGNEGCGFPHYHIGPVWQYEERENGKLIGLAYDFDNKGSINFVREFIDGKRQDLTELEEKAIINKLKVFECFYPNGNSLEVREMKNGKVNGKWKRFYENGTTRYLTTHKDGVLHGQEQYFYPNGQLRHEIKRVDGKQADGLVETFYENGIIKRAIYLVNNEYEGLITEWHENGEKKFEQLWSKGSQVGETKYF